MIIFQLVDAYLDLVFRQCNIAVTSQRIVSRSSLSSEMGTEHEASPLSDPIFKIALPSRAILIGILGTLPLFNFRVIGFGLVYPVKAACFTPLVKPLQAPFSAAELCSYRLHRTIFHRYPNRSPSVLQLLKISLSRGIPSLIWLLLYLSV